MKNILSLLLIVVVAFYYLFEAEKPQTPKIAVKKIPVERATAINYQGAMVIKDLDSIEDILDEMEAEPTAATGTFDLVTMSKAITSQALKAFSDSKERSLPLVAHWNLGIPEYTEAMDPMYMISRIEQGEHILVSWKLDPYFNDSIGSSYYEKSIKKAAQLKLPLVFVLPAPESALTQDDYYFSLDKKSNPNVVNSSGDILKKLSPFGPDELWNEIGEQWSSTSLMAQLQEWYPNPPLVLFVSQDEAAKLSWSELASDSRYTGSGDDNFKHTLIGAEWIEKYRQMHDGFKKGFSKTAWKNNTKFITYNKFSDDIGTSNWLKNATVTNHYINIWPLTADGATVNFDLSGSKTDNTANAPHVLANNLPFMLNEAKLVNPNFAYQLNLNANSKLQDPAKYRGLTQFALWFLRPSIIRQASKESSREALTPLFQEVADSVELIHYNASLAEFWKKGELVNSGKSSFNKNIPDQYKNDPRWFLLETDANPPRPWANSTEIPVWAFALVKGKAPNREWLVYVQSPDGDMSDITVSVPGYKDVLVDGSVLGSFYSLSEVNNKNTILNQENKKSIVTDSILQVKYGDTNILSSSKIYYVDATNGNDNNHGLSQEKAWKSLIKVNATGFNPGDNILFKSAEKWVGTLQILKSGSKEFPITYGAYDGDKPPVITTFIVKKVTWEEDSSNIWRTSDLSSHSQRIALASRELLYAVKKTELGSEVPDLIEWHQDDDYLYIFSATNPSNKTLSVNEEQNTLFIMADYITIQDIEFEGGTQGSIKVYNSSHITLQNIKSGKYSKNAVQVMGSEYVDIKDSIFDAHFTFDYSNADEYKESSARGTTDAIIFSRSNSNCVVSNSFIKNWCHGSMLIMAVDEYEIANFQINNNYMTSPDIVYGGRFSIYGNVHDIEVFNNDFISLSTQNQINGYNNHIHHNIFDNIRSSLLKEFVNIGVGVVAGGHNNLYENNVFANTESEGFKLMGAETHDITFRNNILYNCGTKMNGASIGLQPNDGGWKTPDSPDFQNNSIHNNIIYNDKHQNTIKHYLDGDMTLDTFENKYTSMPSYENYNINPKFISEDNFHLKEDSPAINKGSPSLAKFDKDNNKINNNLDIGPYIIIP